MYSYSSNRILLAYAIYNSIIYIIQLYKTHVRGKKVRRAIYTKYAEQKKRKYNLKKKKKRAVWVHLAHTS